MNLTVEEYQLGHDIVNNSLKIDDNKIETYIRDSIKSFIDKINMSNLQDRNKLFNFLQHISTLFINYDINHSIYLLSEKEKNKSIIGLKIVSKVIKEFKE